MTDSSQDFDYFTPSNITFNNKKGASSTEGVCLIEKTVSQPARGIDLFWHLISATSSMAEGFKRGFGIGKRNFRRRKLDI